MRCCAPAFVTVLAVACSGKPPHPQPTERVSCLALDNVRRDLANGRLRTAAAALEPVGRFCDRTAAQALRAELLIDLARYGEARAQVDDLVRAGVPDATALQSELHRRTSPPSADQLARATKLFREALESGPDHAPRLFLDAWSADPPNGLALVRAALVQRAQASDDASRAAVRKLLERGVAELERETGRHAHAGRRAPPVCAGHFSNHLTVAWLPDSRHAVVRCTDGSAIVDTVTGARVANHGAEGIDESRLPRLRFTSTSSDDVTDRLRTCPSTIGGRLALDEGRGVLTSTSGQGSRTSSVLSDVFRSVSKQLGAQSDFPPQWSLHCLPEAPADLVFIRGQWMDRATLPTHGLAIYDIATGRFIGVAAGDQAHVVDGGRIVVRGPDGITVFGKGLRTPVQERAPGADLSYDGKQLVFAKEEKGGIDTMFRPVWPYVRHALRGPEQRLGDFGSESEVELPLPSWPRVGPLDTTTCAQLGVMPGSEPQCTHPGIRLDGIDYRSDDEVACSVSREPSPSGDAPPRVMCLDPRGPVAIDDPWAEDFVCRVGPHVLPLGACPHLLADR